ncbi:hypothetical protein [Bradyrhizobium japonicum]|uniref:hypothetical protein n=1 Tax=Bradyrhizobium japonicum TaxID=375 RepID=UPI002714C415|nr:hypothetical protein [Bradyrhizobium japonicum]WLB57901.1 hypothetical protein QIH94_18490 [Bradyrhizobium japonicum]WLB60233.1 hypothetical protein QIH96_27455 [Bradyrhizobium japonicum]
MRRAMMGIGVVVAMLAGLYFYGSPQYRALKKECVETGMEHSDAPSDDDLHRLWMACRKIGFGAPL